MFLSRLPPQHVHQREASWLSTERRAWRKCAAWLLPEILREDSQRPEVPHQGEAAAGQEREGRPQEKEEGGGGLWGEQVSQGGNQELRLPGPGGRGLPVLLQERPHGQVLREVALLQEEEDQEVLGGERLPVSPSGLSEDVPRPVSRGGRLLQGQTLQRPRLRNRFIVITFHSFKVEEHKISMLM